MAYKSDAELAAEVKEARRFFKAALRRKVPPPERDRVLAAAKGYAERAEAANAALARRREATKESALSEGRELMRLGRIFGPKTKRAELRKLALSEAELRREAEAEKRAAEVAARRKSQASRRPAPVAKPSRPSHGWRAEDGGGQRLAALFGSPTLWALARSKGMSGQLPECLSAGDIAILWWLLGRLEEDQVDSFVVERGAIPWPLRGQENTGESLDRLVEVGLLARSSPVRGRVEYSIGPSALRIISAAEQGRTLAFERVEDQEAA